MMKGGAKIMRMEEAFWELPPGVRHGIFNTRLEELVFIVVASPPSDMPVVDAGRNAKE